MAGKNIRVPRGVARVDIVSKTKKAPMSQSEYDRAIEDDYEAHRAQYIEVMLHGVPVKVKVLPVDES